MIYKFKISYLIFKKYYKHNYSSLYIISILKATIILFIVNLINQSHYIFDKIN